MDDLLLYAEDNRIALRRLIDDGVRVHAVVTDPPYGMVSVHKRFGKKGSKAARTTGNDGSFARLSGGFMGKIWDSTGIERDPEFWQLIHDILLPGGCVFAFSGARTGHWQACAMETAGFIMHPMHFWAYGSGFPKAHNASKAIDKHLGTTEFREKLGVRYEARRFAPGATVTREGGYRKRETEDGNDLTFEAADERGGSPEAQQWDGYAYGTQTQKPAAEPIYLAQRPYDGKPVESILKHGVGAFNIDGCRVPGKPWTAHRATGLASTKFVTEGETKEIEKAQHTAGRHPANLLHDGSEEVAALFPDSAGSGPARRLTRGVRPKGAGWGMADAPGSLQDAGSGSAARFFNSFPLTEEDIAAIPPFFYHAKAGKNDRAAHLVDRDAGERPHPTVKPIGLLQHLVRHICPPGGTVLDPFAGSGTTAEAARREGRNSILMEAESEYVQFLRRRFDLPIDQEFDDLSDLLGPGLSAADDLADLL